MFRTIIVAVAAVLYVASAFASEVPDQNTVYNCDFEPACDVSPGIYGRMASAATGKFKVSIGGYAKFDYVYNSVNLGPANATGLLATFQPNGIPKTSSPAGKQDESLFSARQSRLWFKVDGPTFQGAKTGSLIEGDFFGSGGSNESPLMRLRLAYGTLDWANTQLLFGQY